MSMTGNLTATLRWSLPLDTGNGNPDVSVLTGYVIDRTGPDTATLLSIDIAATLTSYDIVFSQPFQLNVRITAKNAAGTGIASEPIQLFIVALPSVPLSVNVAQQDLAFSVSWSEPSDKGGGTISSYTIQSASDSQFTTSVFSTVISSSNGADAPLSGNTTATLTKGTLYYIRVAATNAAGRGPYSSVQNKTAICMLSFFLPDFSS